MRVARDEREALGTRGHRRVDDQHHLEDNIEAYEHLSLLLWDVIAVEWHATLAILASFDALIGDEARAERCRHGVRVYSVRFCSASA